MYFLCVLDVAGFLSFFRLRFNYRNSADNGTGADAEFRTTTIEIGLYLYGGDQAVGPTFPYGRAQEREHEKVYKIKKVNMGLKALFLRKL